MKSSGQAPGEEPCPNEPNPVPGAPAHVDDARRPWVLSVG